MSSILLTSIVTVSVGKVIFWPGRDRLSKDEPFAENSNCDNFIKMKKFHTFEKEINLWEKKSVSLYLWKNCKEVVVKGL